MIILRAWMIGRSLIGVMIDTLCTGVDMYAHLMIEHAIEHAISLNQQGAMAYINMISIFKPLILHPILSLVFSYLVTLSKHDVSVRLETTDFLINDIQGGTFLADTTLAVITALFPHQREKGKRIVVNRAVWGTRRIRWGKSSMTPGQDTIMSPSALMHHESSLRLD